MLSLHRDHTTLISGDSPRLWWSVPGKLTLSPIFETKTLLILMIFTVEIQRHVPQHVFHLGGLITLLNRMPIFRMGKQ